MREKRQQAERRGRKAETAAAWFLRLKGYRILEERYRSPYGEIDLIAARGHQIVMVEVKARQTEALARESVSLRQRGRIEKAALDWLAKNRKMDNPVRFDVITIAPGHVPTHIKDAWRPEA
ncbi:MAG: YraN family protein [Alphaproteobacteria bacterium]|nr:YraN family protein [Alphaproteobacteria bacterium]